MTVDGAVIPQAPAAAEDGKARTGASDQQRRYIHCPKQPERGKASNLFMACTKASLKKRESSSIPLSMGIVPHVDQPSIACTCAG